MSTNLIATLTFANSGGPATVNSTTVNVTQYVTNYFGFLVLGDIGGGTLRILAGDETDLAEMRGGPASTSSYIPGAGLFEVRVVCDVLGLRINAATDSSGTVKVFAKQRTS
jgi:hypothetical protein